MSWKQTLGGVTAVFFSAAALMAWADSKPAPELLGVPPMGAPKEEPSAERVELGKKLFFDKRLSRDKTVSCATCHDPAHAFAEPRPVSIGVKGRKGGRNAPSILNIRIFDAFFWDGRAASLEEQALGPIENPLEMDLPRKELVKRLSGLKEYREAFQKAFGGPPTAERAAQAIADFERTVVAGRSALDRYLYAGEKNALSAAAARGLELFRGKALCTTCHEIGPEDAGLTDYQFHNIGVGMVAKSPDLGRHKVTKKEGDQGRFKTPTLRNISKTAPYMHDGSVATLEAVIDYYDGGGEKNHWLDPKMKPLELTPQEKADLVELLKALDTDIPYAQRVSSAPAP